MSLFGGLRGPHVTYLSLLDVHQVLVVATILLKLGNIFYNDVDLVMVALAGFFVVGGVVG